MPRPRWIRWLGRGLRVLLIAYSVLLAAVFCGQRHLIYHPQPVTEAALLAEALRRGAEPWRNEAGELIGWKRSRRSGGNPRRLLLFHGNAGNALDRIDYANGLLALAPFDVYVVEYPGFGSRPGYPTQQSILDAAREAMSLLVRDQPVYVIGESLGTGVAAFVAGTFSNSVTAVLLVTPFHNLTEVGQYQMPLIPVGLLLLDRYPAAAFLRAYPGPVALVIAGQDAVIPGRFGRKLFDAYPGTKRLWEVPDAGHDVMPHQPAGWWSELAAFWNLPGVDAARPQP